MPVFSKDDKNFLFVHVPKTGGTTVEKVFINEGWKVKYRTVAGTAVNKVTVCTPQHFHAEMLQQIFKIAKFDGIFTVVRDPYSRVKSEYAMRTKKQENLDAEITREWLKRKFEQYQLNQFVNDNHIRPQTQYLLPTTKIYKLESGMGEIFKSLNKDFGVDIAYDDSQKFMTSNKVSGYSSSSVELNKESISMINNFYHYDFLELGYEKKYQ